MRRHRGSSTSDVTGCSSPIWRARSMRPASVVMKTSHGLLSPSALQPLDQRIGLGIDAVDLDAGQLGEVAVERLVGVVVARRIEVERAALCLGTPRMSTPAPKARPVLKS